MFIQALQPRVDPAVLHKLLISLFKLAGVYCKLCEQMLAVEGPSLKTDWPPLMLCLDCRRNKFINTKKT